MLIVGGLIAGTMSTRGLGSYMAIEEYIKASMALKNLGMNFSLVKPLMVQFTLATAEGEIQISTLETEYAAPKQLTARLTMKYTS